MKFLLKILLTCFFSSMLFAGTQNDKFKIINSIPKQNSINVSKYNSFIINFNKNIDEVTLIGNVSFKNSDNANVEFTKSIENGKKLVITPIKRLLDKTKYSIKIKKSLKSTDNLELSNPQNITFLTSQSVGVISKYKGKAFIKRNNKNLPAQFKSSIQNKDIIQTNKKTKLQLTFDDNTLVTIGSKTIFEVEEFINEEKEKKAKFKVDKGYFKTISGKIGKTAPKNFLLKTKTALIGVRGTVFEGYVSPNKNDWVTCLRGKVIVTSQKTQNSVTLSQLEKITIDKFGNFGPIKKIKPSKYNRINKY